MIVKAGETHGSRTTLLGYVLHKFSKVGSTEQIFFLKKTGSWEQFFVKISVFGAEILTKSELGLKMLIFFPKKETREHKNSL